MFLGLLVAFFLQAQTGPSRQASTDWKEGGEWEHAFTLGRHEDNYQKNSHDEEESRVHHIYIL